MQAAVSDLLQARIEIAGIGLAGEQAPTGGIRGDRVLMSQSIDRHRGVAGQPTLQVCEQTVCRLIAIRRVLAQELVDDRCQQGVAVRRLGVGQRWRLCQVAMQQGDATAAAIAQLRMEEEPQPFQFEDRGEMLSLGVGEATLTGMGLTMAGPLAFQLRRATYLTRLPGLSLGLRSAGAWLLNR